LAPTAIAVYPVLIMAPVPCILMVDDNAGDIQLVHRAMSSLAFDATLYAVQSVELAASFLAGRGAFAGLPRPDLVVLDLHLQESSGFEILGLMRSDLRWRSIPVSVLTLDDDQGVRDTCFALGADDFNVKPADESGYRELASALIRLLGATPATGVDLPVRR
jgi:CheY-like chemotaxis protein